MLTMAIQVFCAAKLVHLKVQLAESPETTAWASETNQSAQAGLLRVAAAGKMAPTVPCTSRCSYCHSKCKIVRPTKEPAKKPHTCTYREAVGIIESPSFWRYRDFLGPNNSSKMADCADPSGMWHRPVRTSDLGFVQHGQSSLSPHSCL